MDVKNIKNILIVSLSNIGDVVLTLPVANVLKGNYPEADISIVIGPKAKPLFHPTNFFKEVIVYDKELPLSEKAAFMGELWGYGRFDLVIDLKNTAIPFLTFARKFNSPFQAVSKKKIRMQEKHLEKLKFLNLSMEKRTTYPLFGDQHVSGLREKIHSKNILFDAVNDAIVISPGARHLFKAWPVASFQKLCEAIKKENPSQLFLLTGSQKEREVTQQLLKDFKGEMYDYAGEFTINEFACLLSRAKLLISNDSAAMHIANYQKAPVVSIFGPTDPEKYGETSEVSKVIFHQDLPCRPCEKATCPTERECLNELSSDTVFRQVKDLLAQKA